MITKCSRCGHQKMVNSPLYSSPAIKCDACGNYFYESKFIEAALYPQPVNVKEHISFPIYIGGIIGIIFFLVGIYSAINSTDISSLGISLIGLLILSGTFYVVWSANKEYTSREETYQKALAESKLRLKNKSYQDLLISCSAPNDTLTKLLDQYNQRNGIVFTEEDPLPNKMLDITPTAEQSITPHKKTPPTAHPPIIEITKPENNQNLYCRKCGTKLFDDSVFCHRCGVQIRNI